MNFQYAIIGIGIISIGFFIYIISLYAMKGQTYEEALSAQRKLNQVVSVSRKDESKHKDKKEKPKKNSKKEKSKEPDESEKTKQESKLEVKATKSVQLNSQPPSVIEKIEKCEKKQILAIGGDHLDNSNKINKINERLNKNNNFVKTEISNVENCKKTNLHNAEKLNGGINLINPTCTAEEKKQKNILKQENNVNVEKDDGVQNDKIILEHKLQNTVQDITKNKLKISSLSQLNLKSDISVTKLVELIKNMPLSNEETQFIIDALLSKNSEGTSDWINKNDPITVLKKQLKEKENDLNVEIENHERAKARIILMRDEINQEKQRHANYKDQINFLNQKNHQLETKLQKIDEIKSDELNKLKINFNKLQMKLSEEHNVAVMKLNEEQARTQQALNQLEKEKSKQSMFNFKLIQLNNERQQFDGINANLEKLNEELKNENKKLKDHINQLKNEIEINEFNYKEQLSEKEENYKSIISKVEEKSKELNSNVFNTAQLQVKLEKLVNENEKLFSDFNSVNQSLHVLKKEKKNFMNILNELFQDGNKIEDENKSLEILKEFIKKYKDLIDQQLNLKNEVKILFENLEDVKVINNTLQKKVSHYENTLLKAENDLIQISGAADKEVRDLNLRIENIEKAYQNIISENEKLTNKIGS